MCGRRAHKGRLDAEWVGRTVSRIGKAAGVVVEAPDEFAEKPAKFASAHDLRRSCAERLLDAGIPPIVITGVLRHASWETTRRHYAPGDVQRDAGVIREKLADAQSETDVPRYSSAVGMTQAQMKKATSPCGQAAY